MRVQSKNTSINTLNKVYKQLVNTYTKGTRILDYGCGRYDTNKQFAEASGFEWYGYDPGWKTDEENKVALNCDPDIIICSNVLNVVDDETLFDIIKDIGNRMVPAYYTVYEGDKTGVCKKTTKGYQRNKRASEYIGWLSMMYGTVKRKGNIIYCSHSKALREVA